MPNYKDHLRIALLVLMIVVGFGIWHYGPQILTYLIYSPLFFIGALLPDLDSPSSKIRSWFFMVVLVLAGTLILLGYYTDNWVYAIYAVFGVWLLFSLYLTKHRGLLHSIHFTGVMGILLYLTIGTSGMFLLSGYILHLLSDGVFKNG